MSATAGSLPESNKAITFTSRNLSDLKSEYRRLAFKHHPDRGGDNEVMAAVNAAFDDAYARLVRAESVPVAETARSYRADFYTECGWRGDRYESDRSTKNIAAQVRRFLKDEYADCRFSVRVEHGTRLCIDLMEAPRDAYREGVNRNRPIQNVHGTDGIRGWDGTFTPSPASDWVLAMAGTIRSFTARYQRDDSDSRFDHFDYNFLFTVGVGRWNKPFRVVDRKPRARRKGAIRPTAPVPTIP